MRNKINYIDVFSGAGGLSEGFNREGFHPIAHVEGDENACATLRTRLAYQYNSDQNNLAIYERYLKREISRDELWSSVPVDLRSSVICRTISDETIPEIFSLIDNHLSGEKVHMIIGGPPCQAYSLVGRSRDPNRMEGDTRNFLFRHYAKFLNRYKPMFFVFENVLGLMTAGKYLCEMRQLFKDIGYESAVDILNAEDYGVLQKRRRVIIIGRRGKKPFEFPKLDKIENQWRVKKDLFSDLPPLKAGGKEEITYYTGSINEYLKVSNIRNGNTFTTQHITRPHNERDLKIYSIVINKWINEKKRVKYTELPESLITHKNQSSFLDRFKVIDPQGHSHTMVAHIAKDGHYYIYPDIEQIRSISVREAARIQSFPDDYFFEGGRTAAFRQIGNAVPPLMAQALAKKLYQLISCQ